MKSYDLAKKIRIAILKLSFLKKTSHIGGSLSVVDILSVLYSEILFFDLKDISHKSRDRLFYSKGHASAALYATLGLVNFFDINELFEKFTENGSFFTSHVNHNIPGVELSTGSLGMALGVACGVATAAKRKQSRYKVYVILSDGELDEGSNWEAILYAQHHKLDNLIVIIDFNKIQSFGTIAEVMSLEPLAEKFSAFNWRVLEINGHNHDEIKGALNSVNQSLDHMPTVIIANTTKGKGVDFMENSLAWHYKSPNDEELDLALNQLEKNYP
jgi:transketolase